ncbi:MAG: hypothetical protein ACRCTD_07760 [Beijerinckiaceae bacterium]
MLSLSALLAGFWYATIVFAAGFALGAMRETFVRQYLGDLTSVIVEIPFMLLLSWFVAQWLIARHTVPHRILDRVMMGIAALVLLLIAEAGVGIFLMKQSLWQHISSYFSWRGAVTIVSQGIFALIPCLFLLVRRPA